MAQFKVISMELGAIGYNMVDGKPVPDQAWADARKGNQHALDQLGRLYARITCSMLCSNKLAQASATQQTILISQQGGDANGIKNLKAEFDDGSLTSFEGEYVTVKTQPFTKKYAQQTLVNGKLHPEGSTVVDVNGTPRIYTEDSFVVLTEQGKPVPGWEPERMFAQRAKSMGYTFIDSTTGEIPAEVPADTAAPANPFEGASPF
jgi:hypothetical protein